MWAVFALGSAVFAALTSILAKVGISGVNSHLATAIRTLVVVAMSWGMVFLTHSQSEMAEISRKSWLFLILSGLATGASWLCYYRALQLGWLFRPFGIALILLGIVMWALANFHSRLDQNIVSNTLVTTGVYAWVRNPIYSAFMLACTGVLLLVCNLWLLILPPLYWLLMTLLVSATEEKWLRDLYGQQYVDYCARVNRCLPWFPKK